MGVRLASSCEREVKDDSDAGFQGVQTEESRVAFKMYIERRGRSYAKMLKILGPAFLIQHPQREKKIM